MKNPEGVTPDLYNEDYYINNCQGYTEDGNPCPRLLKLFSYAKNPSTIIDIGCGRGEANRFFSGSSCHVFSVDFSPAVCNFLKKGGKDYSLLMHDLSSGLPWLKDEYFEVAILADVLEHLYDFQLGVLCPDILRIIKKGGQILIDTPIVKNGNSTLHVNVKKETKEIIDFFPGTKMEDISWFMEPYHCNIILRKLP
jgi:SAM-dependent methyltransferase